MLLSWSPGVLILDWDVVNAITAYPDHMQDQNGSNSDSDDGELLQPSAGVLHKDMVDLQLLDLNDEDGLVTMGPVMTAAQASGSMTHHQVLPPQIWNTNYKHPCSCC